MTDDTDDTPTGETAIDAGICERVAAERDVDADDLAGALDVVAADLTDEHSRFEREYDHTTVEGSRIYFVDGEEWADIGDRLDLSESTLGAVRAAHEEQAERLLSEATTGYREKLAEGTAVVAGVDTAEEMV
ncbi:hypothetical protein [Halomarina litorea]|uniref:hypothetical protein n=1 Tax=Halomarina litorea TaxID=2961595 RepID=UPI0020C2E047|nr:hypothetical protein [Halomarina sp. BCD28]